jgi:lipoate-protein ligase A
LQADILCREEIGTEEFVGEIDEPPAARGDLAGRQASPGGTITTYLRLEGPAQNRVRAALITGDFFITPPRVIYDLESRLRGVYLDELIGVIQTFFEESQVEVLSVSADDFIASVEDALANE